MNENQKKLIELRVKVNFYKKLKDKIDSVMECELEIDDWSTEVYNKNRKLEAELDDLKVEMDLSDEEWVEDEISDVFKEWADQFFKIRNKEGKLEYFNNYFSCQLAYDEFIKFSKRTKCPKSKFKKQMKVYCELNEYTLNPRELQNHLGRIIGRIDGKIQNLYFIKPTK